MKDALPSDIKLTNSEIMIIVKEMQRLQKEKDVENEFTSIVKDIAQRKVIELRLEKTSTLRNSPSQRHQRTVSNPFLLIAEQIKKKPTKNFVRNALTFKAPLFG